MARRVPGSERDEIDVHRSAANVPPRAKVQFPCAHKTASGRGLGVARRSAFATIYKRDAALPPVLIVDAEAGAMHIAVFYDYLQTVGGGERVALTLANDPGADLITTEFDARLPRSEER